MGMEQSEVIARLPGTDDWSKRMAFRYGNWHIAGGGYTEFPQPHEIHFPPRCRASPSQSTLPPLPSSHPPPTEPPSLMPATGPPTGVKPCQPSQYTAGTACTAPKLALTAPLAPVYPTRPHWRSAGAPGLGLEMVGEVTGGRGSRGFGVGVEMGRWINCRRRRRVD